MLGWSNYAYNDVACAANVFFTIITHNYKMSLFYQIEYTYTFYIVNNWVKEIGDCFVARFSKQTFNLYAWTAVEKWW